MLSLFNRYCTKCEKTIENRAFKNEKLCEDCKTELLLQCAECKEKFETYRQIVYHLKNTCKFQDLVNECPKCGKKIETDKRFRYHLKYCGTNEKFYCDTCSYETRTKENLRKHLKRCYDEGKPNLQFWESMNFNWF